MFTEPVKAHEVCACAILKNKEFSARRARAWWLWWSNDKITTLEHKKCHLFSGSSACMVQSCFARSRSVPVNIMKISIIPSDPSFLSLSNQAISISYSKLYLRSTSPPSCTFIDSSMTKFYYIGLDYAKSWRKEEERYVFHVMCKRKPVARIR